LTGLLHPHVSTALEARGQTVPAGTFNSICHVVEQSVQTIRRLKIFSVAQKYPVLIQSDSSAAAYCNGSAAVLETNVGMQFTLARIPTCRSVLSVSPINDMIHDRTMNALNAGCVAILEDSPATKGIFKHGKNALLFRYDDDSIEECLDIVCNQPERAYDIAQAGMQLRDDPRLRFGRFHNILDLARRDIRAETAAN
jgi:Glycosyl transferases group 1